MSLPNESFKIVTPTHVLLHLKDWPLVDPTLTDPTNVNALVLGEWLTVMGAAGLGMKAERANAVAYPSWVCYAQKGAYDIQFQKIVPLIMHGSFMADTWVFNRAGGIALGDKLTPKTVAIDGINRAALDIAGGGNYVVGYALRLPAGTTSPLRFLGNY